MDVKTIIAIGAAYAAIYYLTARRLLSELNNIDPEYLKYLGAHGGIGPSNSSAIIKIVFDGGVPKVFYPQGLKFRLALVRVMLALSPIILLAFFIAM